MFSFPPRTCAFVAAQNREHAYTLTQTDLIALIKLDDGMVNVAGKLDVFYPFIGNVYNSQKYNFITPKNTDAAFRWTVTGAGTATSNSNGVTTSGSVALDTKYIPSVQPWVSGGNGFKLGMGLLQLGEHTAGNFTDMGAGETNNSEMQIRFTGDMYSAFIGGGTITFSNSSDTVLFVQQFNSDGTVLNVYHNGSLLNSGAASFSASTTNSIYIGALHNSGGAIQQPTPLTTSCALLLNEILTSGEQSYLYASVHSYIANLGRA